MIILQCLFAVVTISFNQSSYSVDEDGGALQAVLVLNTSLSFSINIDVIDRSRTATRKCIIIIVTKCKTYHLRKIK